MPRAQLIRDSFEVVHEMPEAIAVLFYGRLFDLDPSLRALFKVDMRVQSAKLMDMLASVVNSLDRFDQLRPALRELGARHVDYGVKPEHYATLAQALLWALGQALQPHFDQEMRAAWREVLNDIAAEMLAGAAGRATPT